MARTKQEKNNTSAAINAFINFVELDAQTLQCIAENDDETFMARLDNGLRRDALLRQLARRGAPNMRTFLSWCSNRDLPNTLATAIHERKQRISKTKFAKRDFLRNSTLSWTAKETAAYLNSIPTFDLKPPSTPYPPFNCAIAETRTVFNLWKNTLLVDKQPDARRKRATMALLDRKRLIHDLFTTDSAIFRDSQTGEVVMVVLRRVCGEPELLSWLDATISNTCSERISIRKEDSGNLAQMGYSAGARNKPRFDWVQNLRSKTEHGRSRAALSDLNSSIAFALFWRMAQKHLLPEILDDFTNYMSSTEIKRMDANGQIRVNSKNGVHPNPTPVNPTNDVPNSLAEDHYIKPEKGCPRPRIIEHTKNELTGTYSIKIKDNVFTFADAELAPPAGVMGENYSRAIHDEHQPHKWAISWTISRGNVDNAGCNFYLARYGVRVQMDADTMVAWRPDDLHGTSLPKAEPDDKDPIFKQRGMAFVTSPRLPGVWKDYIGDN